MKNIIEKYSSCAAMLVALFAGAKCAVAFDAPTANLPEQWDAGNAGWVMKDAVSGVTLPVLWTNEAIGISYTARTGTPTPQFYSLAGESNASFGCFSGNYNMQGIESIQVTVRTMNLESPPSLYFVSKSGNRWSKVLESVPGTTSEAGVSVGVSLLYSAGWSTKPSANTVAVFEADKAEVVELGVKTARYSDYAQSIAIDNLKLVGPWGGPFTNGVSTVWLHVNGFLPSSVHEDFDQDGFTNYGEYLAGTDPTDSNSYFRVYIGQNDQGKTVVRWNASKYVKFDLEQSSDLNNPNGFEGVSGATGLEGTGGLREVAVGGDNAAVKFYRVVVRQR